GKMRLERSALELDDELRATVAPIERKGRHRVDHGNGARRHRHQWPATGHATAAGLRDQQQIIALSRLRSYGNARAKLNVVERQPGEPCVVMARQEPTGAACALTVRRENLGNLRLRFGGI